MMSEAPERVYGIHTDATTAWTQGLATIGQAELRAAVTKPEWMHGLMAYLT